MRGLSGGLFGKKILLTRPDEKSGELARAIRAWGAQPILLPLTRLLEPVSFKALDRAIRHFDSFDAVIFTSTAAAERFFLRARYLKVSLSLPPSLYAVGPRTARALRERGWRKARAALAPRAEGILDLMRDVRGLKILIPRAALGREILPRTLRQRGATVSVCAVYRAAVNPRAIAWLKKNSGKRIDAAIFASGRAVREFVAALGRSKTKKFLERAAAVSIGGVTSDVLKSYGIRPIEVPLLKSRVLAAALKKYFKEHE